MAFFEGCPVGWGGYPPERGQGRVGLAWWTGGQGGRARAWGGCKGFGSGGVSGRGTDPQKRSGFRNVCRIFVVSNTYKRRKMAFFEGCLVGGGGAHRSWPGGWGGSRLGGYLLDLAWWTGVGRGQGRVGLANLLRPWGPCLYHLPPRNRSPCTPPPSPCPASPDPPSTKPALINPPHPTGHPSKKAIFLLFVRVRNNKNTTHVAKFAPSLGPVPLPRMSYFCCFKEEKWRFLKDAPLGWGGGTHRSWPGGRGGRPRALVAGEGWGGRRGDGSSKEGGGLRLGWLFQRGASPGKGSGKGWLGGRGGCKGFGCGGKW